MLVIDIYIIQSIYVEAVTTNREVVANHLAYTHMYMFLVAEQHGRYGQERN